MLQIAAAAAPELEIVASRMISCSIAVSSMSSHVAADSLGVAAGGFQQHIERMIGRQRRGHALHQLDR